jgi:Ca-activated chloride channel family protein
MTLRYPILLLLLILAPLLVYARYRWSARATVGFSDGETLKKLPASLAIRLQPLLPLLYAAGLCLMVIALARPQRGLKESIVRTEAVDIVLVVDVSTSMLAEDLAGSDGEGNRLDAAKLAIERFVGKRPNDRIGMVAFAAFPYSIAPLTLDHSWLLERIRMDSFKPGMLEDGTAIGDGLASAINRLRDSKAVSKVIILLTDGVNNAGLISPLNAAQAAKALGIKVYTVGAGSSGWVRAPVTDPYGRQRYTRFYSEIDEPMLKRMADITGGLSYRASDQRALTRVFEQIDALEKTEIDVEQFTRFEEAFSPFLLFGLICLAVERLLGLTRLGRLP